MTETILDSSAVLAYLRNEPGAPVVAESLGDARVLTVNLAEVVTKLVAEGWNL